MDPHGVWWVPVSEEDPEFVSLRDIVNIRARPGDTLLFRLAESTATEDCERVRDRLREALPDDVNIIVATGIEGVERVEEAQ